MNAGPERFAPAGLEDRLQKKAGAIASTNSQGRVGVIQIAESYLRNGFMKPGPDTQAR